MITRKYLPPANEVWGKVIVISMHHRSHDRGSASSVGRFVSRRGRSVSGVEEGLYPEGSASREKGVCIQGKESASGRSASTERGIRIQWGMGSAWRRGLHPGSWADPHRTRKAGGTYTT